MDGFGCNLGFEQLLRGLDLQVGNFGLIEPQCEAQRVIELPQLGLR